MGEPEVQQHIYMYIEDMRNIVLLILPFLFFESDAQVSYPIQTISIDSPIVKTVIRIAGELGLPKRENLIKDSSLKLYVDSDLNMFSGKYFMSYDKKNGEIIGEGTDSSYLTTPHIVLSPLLYAVFYRLHDTTANMVVKAEAVIVHELAHYIHNTRGDDEYYAPKDFSKEEIEKYLGQPDELYPSSIEAYYYYEKTDKARLKKILNSGGGKLRVMKLLVSTKYNEYYPWRKPISLQ